MRTDWHAESGTGTRRCRGVHVPRGRVSMYWAAQSQRCRKRAPAPCGPSHTRVQRIQRPVTRHCLPQSSPQCLFRYSLPTQGQALRSSLQPPMPIPHPAPRAPYCRCPFRAPAAASRPAASDRHAPSKLRRSLLVHARTAPGTPGSPKTTAPRLPTQHPCQGSASTLCQPPISAGAALHVLGMAADFFGGHHKSRRSARSSPHPECLAPQGDDLSDKLPVDAPASGHASGSPPRLTSRRGEARPRQGAPRILG